MNGPVDAFAPQPGDALVSFRYDGRPYLGALHPSEAGTWQLLVEGEWWGDLSYEINGYRFIDVDGRQHPTTIFDDFTMIRTVPRPAKPKIHLLHGRELRFSDDHRQYHFLVEQQALNRDWELFHLHSGNGKMTLVSDRPFIRRTRGKGAAYRLRLSEDERAAEGFLRILLAHLRRLIEGHFEP